MPKILFLQNEEIDKNLWDECIKASSNELIYARSFYLDNMCPQWCAFIGQNYGWVLPVTKNTKWGITYLYQPSFTQQLGIFSKPGIPVPYQEILDSLQKYASFWEISWHYATEADRLTLPLHFTKASNYVLKLAGNYESIASGYHKDLTKNLRLGMQHQNVFRATNDYANSIALYRNHYSDRLPMVGMPDYQRFHQLCDDLYGQNMVVCREATDKNGEVIASSLLLKDERRLYNIMNTTTAAGRRLKANHFLLDRVIREFAGEDLLFDFEGSDLPGVKSFYQNFGAANEPFFRIKYNNLPWPLNVLKR